MVWCENSSAAGRVTPCIDETVDILGSRGDIWEFRRVGLFAVCFENDDAELIDVMDLDTLGSEGGLLGVC